MHITWSFSNLALWCFSWFISMFSFFNHPISYISVMGPLPTHSWTLPNFYINWESSTLEDIGYSTDIRLTSKPSLRHHFSLYLVTSLYLYTYTVFRVVFPWSQPGSTSISKQNFRHIWLGTTNTLLLIEFMNELYDILHCFKVTDLLLRPCFFSVLHLYRGVSPPPPQRLSWIWH